MFTDNQKYQDILTAAKDLFWKHGLRRLLIEEVCKEAGISKMTYFKFLSNKIELARTVFIYEIDKSILKFNTFLHSDLYSAEIIKQFILLKAEGLHDNSKEFCRIFTLVQSRN
jgi:AcrR family transcriptional regulator